MRSMTWMWLLNGCYLALPEQPLIEFDFRHAHKCHNKEGMYNHWWTVRFEWHTLSFAFVIIARVAVESPTSLRKNHLSLRVLSVLFRMVYTRSCVFKPTKSSSTMWMLIAMTFSLHFCHGNRSMVIFIANNLHIPILNETQIGWRCLFWFDFRPFFSSSTFRWFHSSYPRSRAWPLLLWTRWACAKKADINLHIKCSINSIFAFPSPRCFSFEFHQICVIVFSMCKLCVDRSKWCQPECKKDQIYAHARVHVDKRI